MPRNLHITIFEANGGGARRRNGRRGDGGHGGLDPEPDETILPPDNPEEDPMLLEPDNPEPDETILPPDNPDGGAWHAGAGRPYGRPAYAQPAGAAPALAWISEGASGGCGCADRCCCGAGAGASVTSAELGVRESEYSGFVIVRLASGLGEPDGPDAGTLWELADRLGLDALLELLELSDDGDDRDGDDDASARRRRAAPPSGKGGAGGVPEGGEPGVGGWVREPAGVLVGRPLIDVPGRCADGTEAMTRREVLATIRDLEHRAARTAFRPLHSLAAYWRLDLRQHPDRVDEVVARLNAMAFVDVAYRELAAVDPQTGLMSHGSRLAEDQAYLAEAPVGIGAAWAWQQLTGGGGDLKICDLEQGWHLHHEELPTVQKTFYYGGNRSEQGETEGHHGTAVLGQLAAAGGGPMGLHGGAEQVGTFVLTSHYRARTDLDVDGSSHPFAGSNGHVAAAIFYALAQRPDVPAPLGEGDVLLLEVQRGRWICEVDQADCDAIRLATALGVTVVEAAGNGGFDLDAWSSPHDGRRLRRGAAGFRDSGAVVVGASYSALPHDRAPFSNFGSRLDCFAWGDSVTTCGYGNLAGDALPRFYTNTFAGTSSAAPVIAAAAALVQRLHGQATQRHLHPGELRAVLSDAATGTRQGPGEAGFIGVMPDLSRVCRQGLGLAPEIYLRRSVEDDGSASPQPAMGSSPDVLASVGSAPPTLDGVLRPGDAGSLWVRVRNRGGGEGAAEVRLFASPAATLVTPERWQVVGDLPVKGVLQGDLTATFGPLPFQSAKWPPSSSDGDPAWTDAPPFGYLAVVRPVPPSGGAPFPPLFEHGDGLPPGPPYFDWAAYRAFLRRPGVAWRNAFPVPLPDPQPGSETELELPFFLAGTPDVARRFDFEVVQRLPAAASLALDVPKALAAKLRQRQPWIGGDDGLALPSRRSTRFDGVRLAAGLCARAVFRLSGTGLRPGHSLTLRQIWQGREVGRISWHLRSAGGGGTDTG
jgi:hypothetical protein